ncbi:MAG: phage major capsid protein [Pseudomonadota bacterium]
MKKIAALKKKLAELKAEGLALVTAAENDDRDLTDEEAERLEAIEGEVTATQGEITKLEDLAERRRTMEAIEAPAAGQNAVHDSNPAETGGFQSLTEFATSVRAAGLTMHQGGEIDQRLSAVGPGFHQGGGDAGEGYSLPPQFRNEIWELVSDFDEFGPLIDEEPTSRREVKLGADETTPWGSAGVKAYWRAEGAKMEASQLVDEGRSVPVHELYALVTATEELLEDAPRLQNRLGRKAAEAIAFKKNEAIVEGNGVGQPLGWMKSKAKIVVPKEGEQAAGTVVAENVMNMFTRLRMMPGSSPFWMTNQNVLPQFMTMTIGDRPVWIPPTGLAGAPGGFLMGYPVRFSEFAETLGTQGDLQLIQPRGYYGVRRSAGVKFASSIHLYFDFGLQAFRWTFRYGGQPHLSKPVAANKGDSKSHFITLETRA